MKRDESDLRIAATADWHLGERVADMRKMDLLLAEISSAEPDLLLVLGDIFCSYRPREFRAVFTVLSSLAFPVAVVFGNHDLWLDSDSNVSDSRASLESFCDLAAEAGIRPLDREPFRLGPLFLCGSGGWYDYSLGLPVFSRAQYEAKRNGTSVWGGDLRIRWDKSDEEICHELADRLDEQLALVPTGTEPVVATHMAALPGSVPTGGGPEWDFFSAFWGSALVGEVLRRREVPLHLHGHVHGEAALIPSIAYSRNPGLLSCNTSFSENRPFILCDRHHPLGNWVITPGQPLTSRGPTA